jgi:hypothetical protein
MAKKTDHSTVNDFISAIGEPYADILEALRHILLSFDEIGEHIKWDSPAYFYQYEMPAFDAKTYQRDFVVMNCRKNTVLMIFPNGDKIADPENIFEGTYTDGRRMITLHNLDDLQMRREGLKAICQNWINTIKNTVN